MAKHIREILSESNQSSKFYHTSSGEINVSSNHPIWLSHNLHQAKGWHATGDNSHTYEVHVKGKIAHHDDPKVKNILRKEHVDQDDYHGTLVSNPTSEEIHEHPGTVALKKHGYSGYSHPDYDPHDSEKDHDSTLVFHRHDVSVKKRIL